MSEFPRSGEDFLRAALTNALNQRDAAWKETVSWRKALVAYINLVGEMEGVTYLADRYEKHFSADDWRLLQEARDIADGEME